MPEVVFRHEKIAQPLVVKTGIDEVSWGYNLNVSRTPTYGGEVVQILSCYIDDLYVQGTVRTYEHAEQIYQFFMKYFTIATQGPFANAPADHKFEQVPMTFAYPERGWMFDIQPLSAPKFVYSLETVTPQWQIRAHVVDQGVNAKALAELAGKKAQEEVAKFGDLKLSGELSLLSGDPALNPFLAPVTPSTHKNAAGEVTFEPRKQQELIEKISHIPDYYSNLVKSFSEGNFKELLGFAGSKPAFASPNPPTGAEAAPEEITKAKH